MTDPLNGIRNLIFDMGGVLIDLDLEACIRAFQALGVADVRSLISATHTRGLFSALECGTLSAAAFRDEVRRLAHNPALSDEAVDTAWKAILGDIPPWKLTMLQGLRRRFRVFLLSNTNVIHFDFIRRTQFETCGRVLDDYFERTFLSHEMGMVKPHGEIYETILNEAQIFGRETLFIDDSETNLDAARAWCIETRLYTGPESLSDLVEVSRR